MEQQQGGDFKKMPGGVMSNKIATEKVDNVMGSTAGAGSTEFHKYLSAKKREVSRIETIERQDKLKGEAETFKAKIDKNKKEDEERTRKNTEKRKRKKANQAKNRKLHKANDGKKGEEELKSDKEEAEEEEEQEEVRF